MLQLILVIAFSLPGVGPVALSTKTVSLSECDRNAKISDALFNEIILLYADSCNPTGCTESELLARASMLSLLKNQFIAGDVRDRLLAVASGQSEISYRRAALGISLAHFQSEPSVARAVLAMAEDQHSDLQTWAIDGIPSLDSDLSKKYDVLLRISQNDKLEASVRSQAIVAIERVPVLPRQNRAVIELCRGILKSTNDDSLKFRVLRLLTTRPSREKVDGLREVLLPCLREEILRPDCAMALWQSSSDRDVALKTLAECVAGKPGPSQIGAARHLGKIGREATAILPALTAALMNENISPEVAFAHFRVSGDPRPALDRLISLLQQPARSFPGDVVRRVPILECLARMGVSSEKGVSAVAKLLQTGNEYEQIFAARALCKMDPDHSRSINIILPQLRSKILTSQLAASDALHELDPEMTRCKSEIMSFLSTGENFGSVDQYSPNQMYGMCTAAVKWKAASKVVPYLQKAILDGQTPYVKVHAMELVEILGNEGNALMPAVIRTLDNDNPVVRQVALRVCGLFPASSKQEINTIMRLQEDKSIVVRLQACETIRLLSKKKE